MLISYKEISEFYKNFSFFKELNPDDDTKIDLENYIDPKDVKDIDSLKKFNENCNFFGIEENEADLKLENNIYDFILNNKDCFKSFKLNNISEPLKFMKLAVL